VWRETRGEHMEAQRRRERPLSFAAVQFPRSSDPVALCRVRPASNPDADDRCGAPAQLKHISDQTRRMNVCREWERETRQFGEVAAHSRPRNAGSVKAAPEVARDSRRHIL